MRLNKEICKKCLHQGYENFCTSKDRKTSKGRMFNVKYEDDKIIFKVEAGIDDNGKIIFREVDEIDFIPNDCVFKLEHIIDEIK